MSMSRRDALKLGALGAVGTAGISLPLRGSVSASSASSAPASWMPKPYTLAFKRPPYFAAWEDQPLATSDPTFDTSRVSDDYYKSAKIYKVSEVRGSAQLLGGGAPQTPVYGYLGWDKDGKVLSGSPVPGPVVHMKRGQPVVLRVRNKLPAAHPEFGTGFDTSVHLHGSASLPQYDGYADDVTPPGSFKDYQYPNQHQGARTLWYHDHGVHHTAQNAYSGLAAQYHLHDDQELALLPQGEYDVPLTLSDAMFAADGKLAYDDNSQSGLWGDVILVNGVPWPRMKVKRAVYRFRFLDASISRSYRPSLYYKGIQQGVSVVATDGGLMQSRQDVAYWRHGNAERYEILIDFRKYPVGAQLELKNLSNPNNRDYDNTGKIMMFDVVDYASAADKANADRSGNPNFGVYAMPTALNPGNEVMNLTPTGSMKRRNFRVERQNGIWTINGKTWHDVIDSGYKMLAADPGYQDTEIWTIENKSGGWFHPVHIHLIDFKVLSRNGKPAFAWEKGPKDVIYTGENEVVDLIMRFDYQRGKYMMHCHNLPHEDHDMMQQFGVGLTGSGNVDDTNPDYDDPIKADPCKPDSLG